MNKVAAGKEKAVVYLDTPIGRIGVAEDGSGISDVFFVQPDDGDGKKSTTPPGGEVRETPLLKEATAQLREYFEGKRKVFDLPLSFDGTSFQRDDWNALLTIPYGETRSYKQIAEQIGRPKAYRAVGLANNRNPISILIPCHRVIGHNGALVGYGGGLSHKEYLLNLEKGE
ncbi:MAG: methylated-DNA--[protein]-cysteine S-methyltransferase [Clostridiales bacterium]|nr:methylated-DNA--[protein]-cysteine S-methyltransferase [Clostridiales bacterium]